jgi:opacity protein-like surface antigen
LIQSKVKTRLSGENWNYGAGDSDGTYDPGYYAHLQQFGSGCEGYPPLTTEIFPCYIFPRDFNYSRPINGGETSLSKTSLALALGFDFYKDFKVPVRLELEGTLNSRQNIEYGKFSGSFGSVKPDSFNCSNWYITDKPACFDDFESSQNLQTSMFSIFLNGYLDWHNQTRFTPYIGGGVGLTHFNTKVTQDIYIHFDQENYTGGTINYSLNNKKFESNDSQWVVSWNFTLGFSYQITKTTSIDLSYRFINYGKIKLKPTYNGPYIEKSMYGNYYTAFYTNNAGQSLSMKSQQAVLALRMYL